MDRLRELLFPITILVIVASIYSLAMARSRESQIERRLRPTNVAADTRAEPLGRTMPQLANTDARELLD